MVSRVAGAASADALETPSLYAGTPRDRSAYMKMIALVVLLSACGDPDSPPPPEPGSGSSPTPPRAAPPCLPFGKWYGVHAFEVDDARVLLCTADRICETKHPTCIAYDLATGTASAAAPRPTPPPTPPAYRIVETRGRFELCGPTSCSKVKLVTNDALIDQALHVAVSPDGKVAAIAGERLTALYLVEATTGKQIARITGDRKFSTCFAEPFFLGDTVYARTCIGSFPNHTDFLYRPDGSQLGVVEYVDIPLGDRPVAVTGTQWAVRAHDSDRYVVFDAATGERVRSVPEQPDLEGDIDEARGPIRSPTGKLVVLGRELTVTDPISGNLERAWALPFCPPAKLDAPVCD